MFRFLGLNRNQSRSRTPLKSSDLSQTDEDSRSVSSSVEGDQRPPSCVTHSFQQRFHTDHPASSEMENFSTFMLKAANVLTPGIKEKNEGLNWWECDQEDDDDSETEGPDLLTSRSINPRDRNAFDGNMFSKEEDEEDDSVQLNSTEKGLLYAPNAFSERTLGDIGRANTALGVCSPSFERSAVPDFEPRLEKEDDEDIDFDNRDDFDASFHQFESGTVQFGTPTKKVDTCFNTIQIMSPEDFDTLENMTRKEKRQEAKKPKNRSSSLSSMVHSMDPDLFATQKEDARKSDESLKISLSSSKASYGSSVTSTHDMSSVEELDIKPLSNRFNDVRKRLASSFRSKSGKGRVTYSLSKGKGGMSKKDRLLATSLLPAKPLLSRRQRRESSTTSVPRLVRQHRDRPLSILLLNPVLKIFEIVLVDFLNETTIGEAISKARVAANDEALSEQQYTSLCNRKQEIAAPMLPVSLLVEKKQRRRKDGKLSQEEMRLAMEARLLVAVPKGSTASDCQLIRRVLWKNPRIQRWWAKANPFQQEDDEDDDNDDIEVPSQKAVPLPRKERRRPKVRYEEC